MSSALSNALRKQIVNSQRDAWVRHGYHPNALLWSSQEVQFKRFSVLLEIGLEEKASILDVGCGFGDMADYMENNKKECTYTGIDLSTELLDEAGKRHVGIRLYEGDLFDFDPDDNSYDYVFLSGTLNRNLNDDGAYAYKTLQKMFEVCRIGIAFNLLDRRHEWTASRWDLESFYPQEVLKFIDRFASKSKLIDDYLDNDFTVLAWK